LNRLNQSGLENFKKKIILPLHSWPLSFPNFQSLNQTAKLAKLENDPQIKKKNIKEQQRRAGPQTFLSLAGADLNINAKDN
jgi:hypothetical protein